MKRTRLIPIAFSCVAVLAMMTGLAAANDTHTDKVMASFLKHVDTLDSVEASRRSEIKSSVEKLSQESPDAITEGLIQLYPKYSQAVESSDADSVTEAVELLSPLADSSDKYLAADASFYLARALMNNEQFEDAMPRLEQLTGELGKYTVHQGSAQYFIAVAQAGLLKNDEAVQSFMRFLQFNPDAPERLRVSAWRQVQQIQSIQKGKLDDVYQRMDFSRRRLELIETDEVTQNEQDKIVGMLTKLIKEAEKKECSSNCKQGGT